MRLAKSQHKAVAIPRRFAVFAGAFLAVLVGIGDNRPSEVLAQMQSSSAVSSERILVVGATGRTGRLIVSALQSQGHKVRGLTRNVERAKEYNQEVEWITGDLREPSTLNDIANGVDRIIFAAGSNSFRDPTNIPEKVEFRGVAALVDLGVAANIKHFTMMSSGGVGRSDPTATEGFASVLRWKSEAEKYVRNSGLSYTIVRPGPLSDSPGREFGIGLAQGDALFANFLHVSRADVANVIVESLYNADAQGKTFEMYNGATTELDDWKQGFARLKAD